MEKQISRQGKIDVAIIRKHLIALNTIEDAIPNKTGMALELLIKSKMYHLSRLNKKWDGDKYNHPVS